MDDSYKVTKITVEAPFAEQRIDNYLFRVLKGVPKSLIYRWLRTGQIRVNGKRKKPEYKLNPGDEIRLPPMSHTPPAREITAEKLDWLKETILYEDEALLILNKPAGMPVHAGSGHQTGIIEKVRAWYQSPRIELVHRIDKDTSGCLLLAKKREVLRPLLLQLQNKSLDKTYVALLKGAFSRNKRVQLSLLRTNQARQDKMRIDESGKTARTDFEVLKTYQDCTWVRARIATGRMHQIRAHAKAIDHPIVGDTLYGDREFNRAFATKTNINKLWLHAEQLVLTHPITAQKLIINAPLSPAQASVLEVL